jgi:mevalonate kinase
LEALPETGAQLLAGVRSVVQAAEVALKAGDLARLGALMNINHGLLSAMGVSTAELDQLCHLARGAGAVGAKLTGAGGGGAVLALAPGAEDQVLAAWQTAGYQSFRTRIPCAP